MILYDPSAREEWLALRRSGIGGSDAGCVVGANPYKSARQLWREKSGLTHPPDISDKPAVQFGKAAESPLRALFALTYPQFSVNYHEFRMHAHNEKPFIFATLDGELTDIEIGRRGILEIKTAAIRTAAQWQEWDGRIPDCYYVQILHQLLATGWQFAELFAHIRYVKNGESRATLRTYHIERDTSAEDLEFLEQKETEFWQSVTDGKEPPDTLPEI